MAIGTPVHIITLNSTSVSSGSTTPGTGAGTSPTDSPVGNTIFGSLYVDSSVTLTSVQDDSGNVYVVGAGISDGSGGTLYFFYSTSIGASLLHTQNISYTLSGSASNVDWKVETVSGVGRVDLYGTGTVVSSTTAPTYVTGALNAPDELIYGAFEIFPGVSPSVWTEATGFTFLGTAPGSPISSGTRALRVEYKVVGSAASVTYNPTFSTARDFILNVLTLAAKQTISKTVSVSGSGSVGKRLLLGKQVQPTSAENVLTTKSVQKLFGITLGQGLSVLRGFPRRISLTDPEMVSNASFVRAKSILLGLAESVRLQKGIGLNKGVLGPEVVSSRKTFSGLRAQPSVAQAQTIGLLRASTKVVGIALAESVSAFRNTLGKISVASAEVVSRILIKPKTIQVSSAEFAQAQKGTGQLVGAFSAQVVNLKIRFRFFIHTALAQVVNLFNTPAKVLRAANSETVHLLKSGSVQPGVSSPEVVSSFNSISKAFSTSLDEAFSVFVSNTKFVLLSVGQSQSFSLIKTVFKVLRTGLGQTISSIKSLPKTFSTSLSGAVSEKLQVGKPLSTSLFGQVSILAGLRRITGTTLSQVVLIRKTVFKGIGTTLVQATRALIAKTSTVSVESPQSLSLFSVVGKRISSFLSQGISVGKMQGFNRPVSVHLSQAQSVLARLKVYIRRRQILSIFYKPNSED